MEIYFKWTRSSFHGKFSWEIDEIAEILKIDNKFVFVSKILMFNSKKTIFRKQNLPEVAFKILCANANRKQEEKVARSSRRKTYGRADGH